MNTGQAVRTAWSRGSLISSSAHLCGPGRHMRKARESPWNTGPNSSGGQLPFARRKGEWWPSPGVRLLGAQPTITKVTSLGPCIPWIMALSMSPDLLAPLISWTPVGGGSRAAMSSTISWYVSRIRSVLTTTT